MFFRFFLSYFLFSQILNISYSQFNSSFNNLVWSDEFDGSGIIDTSKWHHQHQLPAGGSWFNGEQQHYTDRITNSYVNNGHLHIVAKKEVFSDQGVTKNYTSARLNSKFSFTYGRVEVMAKLPSGDGTWPAIWMLGKNIIETGAYFSSSHGTTSWPACGEIDIMEHWGHNQNYIQSATHTTSSFGNTINHGGLTASDVSNTFHLYAMEWTSNELKFSLDSNVFYTYEPFPKNLQNWPFDQEQYLLLNIAMGSSWFTIDPFFNSSKMEVDYVRVYQQSPSSFDLKNVCKVQIFPNPFQDNLHFIFEDDFLFSSASIYSFEGKEIKKFQTKLSISNYNWSELPIGVYFIKIINGSQLNSYKIIKTQ